MKSMQLDEKSLGLAAGLLWSLCVFLLGILANLYGFGSAWVSLLGTVYKGYDASLPGALAGLPWAFVDAYVGAFLLAWIYNRLVK